MQTGQIADEDIERLVLRLHEIEVRQTLACAFCFFMPPGGFSRVDASEARREREREVKSLHLYHTD